MPGIQELLKSQKNEVFEIIRKGGWEPADFIWGTRKYTLPSDAILRRGLIDDEYESPVLIYNKNKQFYFHFQFVKGQHFCVFSPGQERPFQVEFPSSWFSQTGRVREWLGYLKREIEAPDLWAEMGKYKTSVSLALPAQLLNEPISASEAEEIAEKIEILAEKIEQQFQLTSEQDKFVRNRLNYLAEAAKRQRSSDWVHTSIGVFVTIAMSLALAPERAKELWLLFKVILGGFIHLIG